MHLGSAVLLALGESSARDRGEEEVSVLTARPQIFLSEAAVGGRANVVFGRIAMKTTSITSLVIGAVFLLMGSGEAQASDTVVCWGEFETLQECLVKMPGNTLGCSTTCHLHGYDKFFLCGSGGNSGVQPAVRMPADLRKATGRRLRYSEYSPEH
jgi:hypothetical protein